MANFKNTRYVTKGISNEIPLHLQLILWDLIDTMEVEEKDYLQVFKLSQEDHKQKVTHIQEEPEYEKIHFFHRIPDTPIVTTKIFIIDDETHSTMLLSNEY